MSELVTLGEVEEFEVTASPTRQLPKELEFLKRYKYNCWSFLTECVFTLDEVDKRNPIKAYPNREYNKIFVDYLLSTRLLALVKHRRMMATWTCCAVGLWELLFHEGARIGYVSKKETDSNDLVLRCKFIYENIPTDKWPLNLRPRLNYKFCTLENPEMNSTIMGFPQGADQLRQYTMRRIFADEFAFWEKAEESWVAMKPTLDGGGSVCLFSTRYPGFFQHVINDTIDDR
jgi:hypothetical protein